MFRISGFDFGGLQFSEDYSNYADAIEAYNALAPMFAVSFKFIKE